MRETAGPLEPLPPRPRRRIRWWPALAALAIGMLRVIWIWSSESPNRQDQVLKTTPVLLLTFLFLLLWLLFASRLAWRVRLWTLAGVGISVIVAACLLKFRGVSGDVVPILEWRWAAASIPEGLAPKTVPLARPSSNGTRPDYPGFLGVRRDGTIREVKLARDWSAEPPRLLWRRPIGAGWSAFAVLHDFAATQEQRGAEEAVTCYDLSTGALRWSHTDVARFESTIGGIGPRATPAIHDGRVYALGATGILNALDLGTGAKLWSRELGRQGAAAPTYGFSASPLVLDQRLIVSAGEGPGRSILAFDAITGDELWAAGDDPPGYSSPMVAELAGTRQVLIFNGANLASHDPEDGRILWSRPWPAETENVSQPLVLPDDRVFVSTGYGVGGKLFEIRRNPGDGLLAELVWETAGLKAKFSNVVHHAGHLYGLDDGILVSLDLVDGERRWKRGRYGHGQLLLVGDLLLVLAENGAVALVEASPEGHHELGRFTALTGKTWNHPALAERYLLVRNDREAACYELPLAAQPDELQ